MSLFFSRSGPICSQVFVTPLQHWDVTWDQIMLLGSFKCFWEVSKNYVVPNHPKALAIRSIPATNLVIAKFSVEVHYPPPDEGELWHFKKANVFHIKRAINGISLERSFADSDKSDKIYLFNKTLIKIKNALSNFMPYETVEFDDRDRLLIHSQIKH